MALGEGGWEIRDGPAGWGKKGFLDPGSLAARGSPVPGAVPVPGVFVYGTLRPGKRGFRLLAPYAPGVLAAWVPGTLYRVSRAYPGARFGGQGTVRGEVLLFAPDRYEEVLALLDRFEGYRGPGRPDNLYVRVQVPAHTERGVLAVAAYEWAGGLEGAPVIPEGVWDGR